MSHQDVLAPDFPVVLRGYDRAAVDQHLRELVERARRAQERADAAERQLSERQGNTAQHAFAEIGNRVTGVLQAAEQEAQRMRAEAEAYSDRLRQSAEQHAHRVRTETEQQAARLVETAQNDAQRHQQAAAVSYEEEQRILGRAREQAAQLLASAQQRADERAERTVAAAAQEAEGRLTGAQAEADRLVTEASRRSAELDAATRALEDRRREAAAEVHRLAEQLQTVARALAETPNAAVDDSPTIRIPIAKERVGR